MSYYKNISTLAAVECDVYMLSKRYQALRLDFNALKSKVDIKDKTIDELLSFIKDMVETHEFTAQRIRKLLPYAKQVRDV